MRNDNYDIKFRGWRFYLVVAVLILIVLVIISRMVYLTVVDREFLAKQGDARSLRVVNTPAYRGMILDRNGQPLAVSTPVDSVWVNPKDFHATPDHLRQVTQILDIPMAKFVALLDKNKKKQFVYVKRGIPPAIAKQVKSLDVKGIYLERMYRRYYPDGATSAQLVGFTNIDNQGQAGIELSYNKQLEGTPGKTLVEQDRYGHTVAILKDMQQEKPGHTLTLSIDKRIQYLTYKTLLDAVEKNKAKSGSVVVLDAKTGEILAMASVPSFNPNVRPKNTDGRYRNRAITDTFEPGSVMKTFAIINALDSGKYTPDSQIDTHPGWIRVGRNIVRDENVDHGMLRLTGVLRVSSNVGISKVTLSLPPDSLWDVLHRVGFGQRTGIQFPGERAGSLVKHRRWAPIMLSTLAFGYGMSATPLQVAHAYSVFANDGKLVPLTLLKKSNANKAKQVLDPQTAHEALKMLHAVMGRDGTGYMGRVPGYTVGGKTGTARMAIKGGYSKDHHLASFVGIAPISNPQLVVYVMVNDPRGKHYYASYVAAPAFSKIMRGALQILNIAPDDEASSDKKQLRHWVAPV